MTAPLLTDVHAHFLTDRYVDTARQAGITEPDGMPAWPSWTVDDHLALMDVHRIGHAVLSVSSPGVNFGDDAAAVDLARHVNDVAAAITHGRPDRFSFFASVPLPAVESAAAEAVRAIDELGAAGIVVMSNSGGQYLGDAALQPLWEELDRRAAVVFIHPTSPPAADLVSLRRPRPMVEFIFETTRTVTDLMFAAVPQCYPRIKFLVPHCGAALPLLASRIELFRSLWPGPNGEPPGELTTHEQLQRFWYDLAGYPLPTQAGTLKSVVGQQRIVYGSDYCWTPAFGVGHQLALLDADTDTDWRALTIANTAGLLEASS